jgi:hypothetical protein
MGDEGVGDEFRTGVDEREREEYTVEALPWGYPS